MAGSWGCPHEVNDLCSRVNNLPCDPGMKGCILYGRYVFANDEKNERLKKRNALNEKVVNLPVPGHTKKSR
ncbi:conserved protein of unknown function [Georgfuchsia toluolica]|uniref:Uncharacterized protein n=1 Tax=Georgfuchsia toluolica TaxID=424218 RepID=A0A916J3V4_9PROT|nr:conserved protein of unknown function [Georgfuchsia toluolica]